MKAELITEVKRAAEYCDSQEFVPDKESCDIKKKPDEYDKSLAFILA